MADNLSVLAREVRMSDAKTAVARAALYRAIRRSDLSVRTIARVTGLSPTRVHQIQHES